MSKHFQFVPMNIRTNHFQLVRTQEAATAAHSVSTTWYPQDVAQVRL